jgi:hypothetical protein
MTVTRFPEKAAFVTVVSPRTAKTFSKKVSAAGRGA